VTNFEVVADGTPSPQRLELTYDVAADGRILALTPASGNVRDQTLTVLMNWQASLEP
jgi:hypothetical protein